MQVRGRYCSCATSENGRDTTTAVQSIGGLRKGTCGQSLIAGRGLAYWPRIPARERVTFAQGRSLATQSSDTLRSRSQVFRKLHQGRGAAVMDIPPLAGRTVAMSLGALPVSYVLNQVSAFSQYVFVHEDHGAGGKMRGSPAP